MIVHECEQGGPEWEALRLGIPTASQFHRIMTTKQRKYAAGAKTYMNVLLAEWAVGEAREDGESAYMVRGKDKEEDARRWYDFDSGAEVHRVGFVTDDDARYGCSPDFLVGDHGGGEIKCPAAHTHVGYLLEPQTLIDDYYHQVQGCLYVSRRAWWDVVSYNPSMPPLVMRVEPDADYLVALDDNLKRFLSELEAGRQVLIARGVVSRADRRERAKAEEKADADAWQDAMFGPAGEAVTRPTEPKQDDYDFESIPY